LYPTPVPFDGDFEFTWGDGVLVDGYDYVDSFYINQLNDIGTPDALALVDSYSQAAAQTFLQSYIANSLQESGEVLDFCI
jgi:hypothetical protein